MASLAGRVPTQTENHLKAERSPHPQAARGGTAAMKVTAEMAAMPASERIMGKTSSVALSTTAANRGPAAFANSTGVAMADCAVSLASVQLGGNRAARNGHHPLRCRRGTRKQP